MPRSASWSILRVVVVCAGVVACGGDGTGSSNTTLSKGGQGGGSAQGGGAGTSLIAGAGGMATSTATTGGSGGVVTVAPQDFNVTVEGTTGVWLMPGGSAQLKVSITRGASFHGAIDFTVEAPPVGVTFMAPTPDAAATEATIVFTAASTVLPGTVVSSQLRAASGLAVVRVPLAIGVRGAAGTLDTSFGAAGVAEVQITPNDAAALGMAVAPDGRVFVVGWAKPTDNKTPADLAVVAFSPSGAPDMSFANKGVFTLDVTGNHQWDEAHGVAFDDAGNILIAGLTSATGSKAGGERGPSISGGQIVVLRLSAAGVLDPTFGKNGVATPAGDDAAVGVAFDAATKKIVVGGHSFRLLRLGGDGALDTTFGKAGVLAEPSALNGQGEARMMIVDGKNNFVLAGAAHRGGKPSDNSVLVRVTAAGALDNAFGKGGLVEWDVGNQCADRLFAVAAASTGGLVASGVNDCGPNGADLPFTIVRVKDDGSPDAAFGSGGVAYVPLTHGDCCIDAPWSGVGIDADGKVYAAGFVYNEIINNGIDTKNQSEDTTVYRLNADGSVDKTFASNGVASFPLGSGTWDPNPNLPGPDWPAAVTVAPDGRVLVAGFAWSTQPEEDVYVIRLWP